MTALHGTLKSKCNATHWTSWKLHIHYIGQIGIHKGIAQDRHCACTGVWTEINSSHNTFHIWTDDVKWTCMFSGGKMCCTHVSVCCIERLEEWCRFAGSSLSAGPLLLSLPPASSSSSSSSSWSCLPAPLSSYKSRQRSVLMSMNSCQ